MMMKAFIVKKKFQQLTATMHVCMMVSMIVLFKKEQVIQPWQTPLQMEMLETGVKDLK